MWWNRLARQAFQYSSQSHPSWKQSLVLGDELYDQSALERLDNILITYIRFAALDRLKLAVFAGRPGGGILYGRSKVVKEVVLGVLLTKNL